ncbi:hypothetical protein AVEN_199381-1 [Araneus ventricosus]|uniref:Uncharacterized protein n=1 Tax=Araneus ventricosus TaxID=182803 RepID=A0A4Y2EJ75_ARAVE|nr:hypothetical protein AVEN_42484-1 [Araneus ventricosus]GBM28381.1 hypothetical protein AVEN_199381-1 [Araneus ventricosus]
MSSSCMAAPGPILLAKLKNCCRSSSGKPGSNPPHIAQIWYLVTISKLKENLSGTRFSLDSDVKTDAENWLNGQDHDFYQAELNKLVPFPYKCLNRFGHYVEK